MPLFAPLSKAERLLHCAYITYRQLIELQYVWRETTHAAVLLYLFQVVEQRCRQHLGSCGENRAMGNLCLRQVRDGYTHVHACKRLLLRCQGYSLL